MRVIQAFYGLWFLFSFNHIILALVASLSRQGLVTRK